MYFRWLKRYMPRGLYGRAALILILPVVTMQLVVSVVFIQRHFEGVTVQMTSSLSRELLLVLSQIEQAEDINGAHRRLAEIASPLAIATNFVSEDQVELENRRRWYDFSGIVVVRTMGLLVPQVRSVQLIDDHVVQFYADTGKGPVRVVFGRKRVSASNPHQLLVNMIFFGGLMTLIAFIYLRNQLRPITRLAAAAEAFGRGRNISYSPSGALEVRAAGNAFIDMRARIERQIETRTMMLSGVSHDLRTPLTRLKLGLSMIEDAEREPLERDVEDMQRLVDEFLEFARGASEGEPEEIDPIDLVSRIVEDCARAGQAVSLLVSEGETGEGEAGAGEAGEARVVLRPSAVRRAVENLIGNAVRYGDRAEVSVRLSARSLRIRVEDDGPGIPANRRDEAIKPFTRLEPARNQDLGSGVGLGLAIVADVARAHGGVLRLGDSDKLGGLRADIVFGR